VAVGQLEMAALVRLGKVSLVVRGMAALPALIQVVVVVEQAVQGLMDYLPQQRQAMEVLVLSHLLPALQHIAPVVAEGKHLDL
jgi:hypothetical protein